MAKELRSAPRAQVRIPTLVEKIGQQPISPDLALAPHYERIAAEETGIGMKIPGIVVDLSENGAFIAAHPFPLLSRLAFTFRLSGFGQVEAIGWVFWRRTAAVAIEVGGQELQLPAGVGVILEALSLQARQAIAALVAAEPPPGAPAPPDLDSF